MFCTCSFIGYAVFVQEGVTFSKGDFLLVYTGDVINMNEAETQERIYQKEHRGCYMYFYSHDGRHFW